MLNGVYKMATFFANEYHQKSFRNVYFVHVNENIFFFIFIIQEAGINCEDFSEKNQ